MKITCVIHSLNGGGAERVMAGLVNRLHQRGHAVTLITLDDGRLDRHSIDAQVVRRALDVMSNSRWRLEALWNASKRLHKLRRAVVESRPDVVLSFCDATNVLTLLATWGLSLPVVVSERSDPRQQSLKRPWSSLRRKLYRNANAVVVLTETAAATVAPWCQTPPIVIASAVDSPPPSDHKILSCRLRKRLVGIGRLEHEKGFDRLIGAFARVAPPFSNWDLRIIGDGSCREELEQQVHTLGLNHRVYFPGWIQPIWPELADSDLFALTSRYEGFPSALLEAMSAGVASIAVDCESGPRAIIENGVDGLLIENNADSIVEGLSRCMKDEELRQRLGVTAIRVRERFGWDAMVDAYEKVLLDA